ncbi:MAG: acetylglutamate kinase [Gammaproteobacteria bacterium]|jgi:acetylglutamate kinase|nr:acetylglutamate kinase [Chromatiales bacterium]MCP4926741.1 acetylglutamate kinase [Gammaproteobacteria bacterium]MDP7153135.1 acetylglutamate kinase [Gammaproteobacteria bacterium]MDP7297428.1 acetylglutamate kinase [Gammaproteobacteria bacterium]MDP7419844.1 acetylglutamate kinase [Gammaproteobacteria bacterium]
MQNNENRDVVVAALKHAAPYIRMFKHKIFVIKAGGEIFASVESTRALIEQIAILHQVGIRIVVVHGGGPQSTELADSLGLTTQFIEGRRVTDEQSLEVAAMVLNGQINTRILAVCRDLDLPAVGISGVDAGLIKAHKRPPVTIKGHATGPVDYGFVGDIDSVAADVLRTQLESGLVPIISPLSADESGTLLNINADTVAAALAAALEAEKLVLVTAAPGILTDRNDPDSLISYVDLPGLQQLRENGSLAAGMLPKATAIEAALNGGVGRVHVISYQLSDSLLLEIFTNEGNGTLVVQNINTLSAEEQAPGVNP